MSVHTILQPLNLTQTYSHLYLVLSYFGGFWHKRIPICTLCWVILVVFDTNVFPFVPCVELFWWYLTQTCSHLYLVLSYIGGFWHKRIPICTLCWVMLVVFDTNVFPFVPCVELCWWFLTQTCSHLYLVLSYFGVFLHKRVPICTLCWVMLVVFDTNVFPFVPCVELFWCFFTQTCSHLYLVLSYFGGFWHKLISLFTSAILSLTIPCSSDCVDMYSSKSMKHWVQPSVQYITIKWTHSLMFDSLCWFKNTSHKKTCNLSN